MEEEKINDTSELTSTRWTRWQDVVERLRLLHAFASSSGHVGFPRLNCALPQLFPTPFPEAFPDVMPSLPYPVLCNVSSTKDREGLIVGLRQSKLTCPLDAVAKVL